MATDSREEQLERACHGSTLVIEVKVYSCAPILANGQGFLMTAELVRGCSPQPMVVVTQSDNIQNTKDSVCYTPDGN